MVLKEIRVLDDKGLRAALASLMVKKAMSYNSEITIEYNGKKANAKSFINVLALNVPQGAVVAVNAKGHDELLAAKGLEEFFKI
ncbi:HPr family phosphocarrier protein [Alloiococcus sp. CFN-8]|uniref:HPr family phosphocarrier protein n=1 Tax=Alloiococcus sp. CFN-8 TaxID=3416081 RepID=UPI003CF30A3F